LSAVAGATTARKELVKVTAGSVQRPTSPAAGSPEEAAAVAAPVGESVLSGLPSMAAVVDACTSAMVLIDATGRIRLLNGAFADLLGGPGSALIGRSVWDVLPVEIGVALSLDWQAPTGGARLLPIPGRVYIDAAGRHRHIAWSVKPVREHCTVADPPDALAAGNFFVATGVDVTRERSAEAAWRERAHTDALTGLGNRAFAFAELAANLDPLRGAGCGLLFCDLDGFKAVNDTHGHGVGDQVLIEVAARLQRTIRDGDQVARLGGDEFLVIVPSRDPISTRAIAARIEQALARPIHVAGVHLLLGVSAGITIADPGDDPAIVLQAADAAMYTHKTAKRSRSARAAD
jgi:cyclic di-GMP phosphodiesterase Gmr